jgi:hypothetical protein
MAYPSDSIEFLYIHTAAYQSSRFICIFSFSLSPRQLLVKLLRTTSWIPRMNLSMMVGLAMMSHLSCETCAEPVEALSTLYFPLLMTSYQGYE